MVEEFVNESYVVLRIFVE